MKSSAAYIAEVNHDHRAILYRCRWSPDDAVRVVPELVRVLADEDERLVDEALRALFLIGTPAIAAVPHVIPLISSSLPITRQLAVLALGQIAHNEPCVCVGPITRALEHDDCRKDALKILAFLRSNATSALPMILKHYESKDASTRKLVITAVAAIDGRSETALRLFAKAKLDRSKLVRVAADKATS